MNYKSSYSSSTYKMVLESGRAKKENLNKFQNEPVNLFIKGSTYRLNISRQGIKQLEVPFGSIFLLLSFKARSSRGKSPASAS